MCRVFFKLSFISKMDTQGKASIWKVPVLDHIQIKRNLTYDIT